jgi:hypothetical protein
VNDKIIDKVRKLLELSKSGNVNEASSAAARAQELMSKYNIEEAALAVESGEEDGPIEVEDLHVFESAKLQNWRGILSQAISRANGCSTYSSMCAIPVNNKFERRACTKIVGPRAAADLVRYMYAYICSEVERLAKEIGKTQSTGRSWHHSFKLGAAIEIAGRISQSARDERTRAVQQAQSSGTALVRVNSALARLDERREAVAARCKEIGLRAGGSVRSSNSAAYEAGRAAGAGIAIGRGKHAALGAGASKSLPK